ncbi:MAG: T9SS type A sorting domain-containing protein [Bacteroidales bacterium]
MYKKITTLSIVLFISNFAFGQNWVTQSNNKKTISFLEEKKLFDNYCKNNKITRGYFEEENKKKLNGWKQFKRRENNWLNQIDPETGKLPNYTKYILNSGSLEEKKLPTWKCLGTNSSLGGYAGIGRINCIAFNPNNSNEFFAGTPGGGLWKTTNGGVNWIPLTDQIASIGVSSIVLDKNYQENQTIYIATGDRDSKDTPSIGVLKSIDGGRNWQTTGLSFMPSEEKYIYKMINHPKDPAILYAATSAGLFMTQDKANNWTLISQYRFNDIEISSDDPNILYAGGAIEQRGSIFVSIDKGYNWETKIQDKSIRTAIAISPAEPKIIYAISCSEIGGLYGIYKSTNSGDSFDQILGTEENLFLLNWDPDGYGENKGQGWYDLTIAANPKNANEVYVGGINTWKTNDGGETWKCVNHWTGADGIAPVHADKHEMVFQPKTNFFFEGNDGGIYKSENGGKTWIDLTNTMIISQIYRIGVGNDVLGHCICGLQDNGTKLLQNKNWNDVNGGDGMECYIDKENPNTQYASIYFGSIVKTNSNWENLFSITPEGAQQGAWITPYAIDPNNRNTIYAGYNYLWKSIDGGVSWEKTKRGSNYVKLKNIEIAPSNSDVILVSTPSYVYKSTDGGETWKKISFKLSLKGAKINGICFKHDDSDTFWVTFNLYNSIGVFETTDGGNNWKDISKGLPNIPINDIVQNKTSKNTELFVGTEFGVYRKKDDDTWERYSNKLPNIKITELEFYYGETQEEVYLFASTYGRGLWMCPLYKIDAVPELSSNLVERTPLVSPNPGNQYINIQSKNATYAIIRNIKGIPYWSASRIDENETININSWPSGTYFIEIYKKNNRKHETFIINH